MTPEVAIIPTATVSPNAERKSSATTPTTAPYDQAQREPNPHQREGGGQRPVGADHPIERAGHGPMVGAANEPVNATQDRPPTGLEAASKGTP